MNGLSIKYSSPGNGSAPKFDRMSLHKFIKLIGITEARRLLIDRAFLTSDRRSIRLAEPRCRLTKRVKHGLQIKGRAAYDFEYVCGGGLLLQGFTQRVEQPRVLDSNDRLGGEVLHQLNLLSGERLDFLAVNSDDADNFVFP